MVYHTGMASGAAMGRYNGTVRLNPGQRTSDRTIITHPAARRESQSEQKAVGFLFIKSVNAMNGYEI